jgi:anti-sigma factor RsiW
MTEDRFHELLNLHLDHEATAAESAELETELQRDPARRRQYRDYCRMQHACVRLFEQEHAAAPAAALEKSPGDAEDENATNPARRVIFPPVAVFAGLGALAACAVFVLIRPSAPPVEPAVASSAPTTVPALAPTVPSVNFVAVTKETPATEPTRPAVFLTGYVPSAQADDGLALMPDITLAAIRPVTVEDFIVPPSPVTPTLQPPRDTPPAVEFISFQFQR